MPSSALLNGNKKAIMMSESTEKRTSKLKVDARGALFAQPCGAVDERECSIMKHLILAETRKSNAPAWVAKELDKMLNCPACRG
jgi:hypothetical protein